MEVGRPQKVRILWNKELKQRFLKTYTNEETRNRYEQRFSVTYLYESKLKKDLYAFSLDEIKDLFAWFNASSIDTLKTDKSVFKRYVDFCIQEHVQVNHKLLIINPFDSLSEDVLNTLVGKLRRDEKHIKSYEEYFKILDKCVNAQDAICFIFSFHGIKTKYIPLIKQSDFDYEKKMLHFMGHDYSFSEKECNIIKMAIQQTLYYPANRYNEKWEEKEKIYKENNDKKNRYVSKAIINLKKSDFIIKGCLTNKELDDEKEPVKAQVVNLRIKRTAEHILGKPMLNSQTIYQSKMYLMLYYLEKDKGIITTNDIKTLSNIYTFSETSFNRILGKYIDWKKSLD